MGVRASPGRSLPPGTPSHDSLFDNSFALVVPCHRVLAADGRPGGFSAHGGALAKLRMLAMEGARPNGTAPLFDDF